jgi:hypothetical protein
MSIYCGREFSEGDIQAIKLLMGTYSRGSGHPRMIWGVYLRTSESKFV